ncbi:MAG TPA: nucleotide exchange factor GrpE [Thermoguttaceae bacterium]|nr:nucleotide exchange factor GrpE [Thermoguttaceae bacterium]
MSKKKSKQPEAVHGNPADANPIDDADKNASPTEGEEAPAAQFDEAAAEQMAADLAGMDAEIESAAPIEPADMVASLRTELAAAEDRVLRSRAELENYRKRASRQMDDERRYANLPLMRDLLPVMDNLDRAIEAAEKNQDASSLLEGVKMVSRQFESVLQQYHCLEIAALGEPFDPHLHEAILQQPSEEHEPGTVTMVTQTGFQLHDRVVRPSQVIVASQPEDE